MSEFGFNHINLNEIDPSRKPVEEGFYTLNLRRVFSGTFEQQPLFKNGNPNPNYVEGGDNTTGYVNLSFVISDHPEHSGRFVSTFLSEGENAGKQLRLLMDATQEPMNDSETLFQYLERVADLNPPAKFKCFVGQKNGTDREGNPETQNFAKLWQAQSL